MKLNRYKAKQILWAGIFLLIAALLLATYTLRHRITTAIYTYEQHRLEASLSTRQALTNKAINALVTDSLFVKNVTLSQQNQEKLQELAKEDVGFSVYKQGKLVAWNANSPDPDEFNPFAEYQDEPLNLTGGVYICKSIDTLGIQIISAIKVFELFSIKNQYLKPKTVPESIAFNTISAENHSTYQIKSNNKTLISLLPNKEMKKQFGWLVLVALLSFAVAVSILLRSFSWGKLWWLKLLAAPTVGLLLINGTTSAFSEIILRLPPWLFNKEFSSIENLLQISFITIFSIPIFTSAIGAQRLARWSKISKGTILPGLLLILAAITAGVAQIVMSNLLHLIGPIGTTSNISRTPALLGILVVGLLGWGMLLLIKSALRLIVHAQTSLITVICIGLIAAGLTLLLPYNSTYIKLIGTVGAILPALVLAFGTKYKTINTILPSLIALAISAVLSLQFISNNQTNTENSLQNIAKSLAVDHDAALESKIKNFLPELEKDSTVAALLKDIPKALPLLNHYISNTYFKEFLADYDIQITACPRGSKLIVENTPQKVDCQNFFIEMATLSGKPIVADRFYILNSNNGRINYLLINSYTEGKSVDNFLAIEIFSKTVTNLPGYPGLLNNKAEINSTDLPTDVSYAKYSSNRLETKVGKFPYPLKQPAYFDCRINSIDAYFFHSITCSDSQHMVVVSKEKSSFIFLISPLVYIFLGAYILATLTLRNRRKSQRNIFTLQKRIGRLSVLLMVISMLVVGAISVGNELSRQKRSLEQGITEKMRSAVTIIEPKVQQVTITWNPREFDSSLVATSNIIYADLNVYTPMGDLMGTSRHEVFTSKLQGYWINPTVFSAIMGEKRDFVLTTEQIGSLKYTSAYAPLIDKRGEIIAILNLPYFIKENEIRQETITLVSRIANTYILLAIIAGLLGYFAAYSISKPLQVLKHAMRKTSIAGQPELLEYRDNDEIGHIVREYNRMASELSKNAQLLAQSEKEKVWREMARQIAHEIKNPLTPIKLSLQQLVRIKEAGAPDWDQRFNEFSKMLLEQVDILARTASQFSSIAKDANANSEVLNMAVIVDRTLSLFAGQKVFYNNQLGNIRTNPLVFADKELMQKAITNLVANALQASADNDNQEVTISLSLGKDILQIDVTDNGYGIPPSLQPRIFEPYFTTKSGGTGLGLVLARKTIEDAGGKIWFESTINVGTTFFIQLPLYLEDDNIS